MGRHEADFRPYGAQEPFRSPEGHSPWPANALRIHHDVLGAVRLVRRASLPRSESRVAPPQCLSTKAPQNW